MTNVLKKNQDPAGLIDGLSNKDYHADTSKIGNSMLGQFRANRARYHGLYVSKTIAIPEPTEAMVFGTLFHTVLLDLPAYLEGYFVPPALAPDGTPWDRRKKDHKIAWGDLEANNEGRLPISAETNKQLLAMRAAVGNNERAAKLVFDSEGAPEQSLWWTDEDTGLVLKCRHDRPAMNGTVIVDIKTCPDSAPEPFAKSVANFGYYRQAAFYCDGQKAVTGVDARMVFCAVSKEEPYSVGLYELSAEAVEFGREQIRNSLGELAKCFETGDWRSPHEKIISVINLPRWAYSHDQWEI